MCIRGRAVDFQHEQVMVDIGPPRRMLSQHCMKELTTVSPGVLGNTWKPLENAYKLFQQTIHGG